tara:strand:+ start:4944 stop:5195 length:252 start_codon:yes stop_codon:yes gene_type:complete
MSAHQTANQKQMRANKMVNLTIENAAKVSTVINKNNPEWGAKSFSFNAVELNDGAKASLVGKGCNSSVLFNEEFKFWSVASFN